MKVNSKNTSLSKLRGVIVFILILFVSMGCTRWKGSEENLAVKEIGELRLRVEYQPSSKNDSINAQNEMEYFKIELDHSDKIDIVEHLSQISGWSVEEVLYYLSYRFKDDIFLQQDQHKTQSVLYHFERSFDLKSGRVFNLGFEPINKDTRELTLLIDSELLDVGPMKIKFSRK